MIKSFLLFAVLLASGSAFAQSDSAQNYKKVSTHFDEYAHAYRGVDGGNSEIWVTTSEGVENPRSRRLARARVNADGSVEKFEVLPFPINQIMTSEKQVDGCPTFSGCGEEYGIFVSNRLVDGKDFGNDLYELHQANGTWKVRRIDEVCPEGPIWDDTPNLSFEGDLLFFSSDRIAPGSGRSQMFVSRRLGERWEAPRLVEGLNSQQFDPSRHSTQSPFLGRDGYLYFASNATRAGDYDIFRVKFNVSELRAFGPVELVKYPGVNTLANDNHPVVSAGGHWFTFSSDRKLATEDVFDSQKPSGDRNLFYVRSELPLGDTLRIRTVLRTHRTSDGMRFEDYTVQVDSNVRVKYEGRELTLKMDANRFVPIVLTPKKIAEPALDRTIHELILKPVSSSLKYVAQEDTVTMASGYRTGEALTHTLIIWDSSVYYSAKCIQDFPIKNIQFFITGYWCPTTRDFADLTRCEPVFEDPKCRQVEYVEPELNCESANELYSYRLNFTPPTVTALARKGTDCIDFREMARDRERFAVGVDSALRFFIDNMNTALKVPCVQREAAKKDGMITVDISGWTDPRGLHNTCEYTGADVDFDREFIKLAAIEDKAFMQQGKLSTGTNFRRSKSLGNELLSDLRAFHTAALLDTLWRRYVPEYEQLRHENKIRVIARGKAISTQDRLEFEKQRSVDVRVSVENDKPLASSQFIPPPGVRVSLGVEQCRVHQGEMGLNEY